MSVLNTHMDEYVLSVPGFDKNTNRTSIYGAAVAFKNGKNEASSIITPELEKLAAKSIGSELNIPVFDSEDITIGNSRSLVIADAENTSQKFLVTFTTLSFGFTQVPTLFHNNHIGKQKDWERKYSKRSNALAAKIDELCITALGTNKTQVIADPLDYATTANVIQVPLAKRPNMIGDLTPIMMSNDYFGQYKIIGNGGLMAHMNTMKEHTTYNDKNQMIQWGDKHFAYTSRITNPVGSYGSGFIVDEGNIGLLFRHDREALYRTVMQDGTEWGIETDPLLGIPLDTYFYESKGDFSAIAGAASADMTVSYKQHFGFAIDVATVVAYNDDLATNANPIAQFTMLNA